MKKFIPRAILAILVLLLCVVGYLYSQSEVTKPSTSAAQQAAAGEETATSNPDLTAHALRCDMTLVVGGDIMLDRLIRRYAQKKDDYTFVTEGIREVFSSADIAIANLEGPVTKNKSVSLAAAIGSHDNYVFTFAPESIEALTHAGIDAVSLANNHILNQGKEGVKTTIEELEESGIAPFGSSSSEPSDRVAFVGNNCGTIGVVGYNQFHEKGIVVAKAEAMEDIALAKANADWVVVMPHWGNEYQPESEAQKALATEFVAAGADAVVGSHPHIVQGHETIAAKPVYYSLGNLVFDQYEEVATTRGLVLRLTLKIDKSVMVEELPVNLLKDGSTVFDTAQ
jgi:poly-gamma-glutamate capsule biosynthesis protein CapA/YwtB (metallophosphatase superfamily)